MGSIKGNKVLSLESFLCEGEFGSGKYYGYNNKKIISLVRIKTKNKTIGYGESLVGIYSPELFQINIIYLSRYFVNKNAEECLKVIELLQKNKFFLINGVIKSLLAAIEIALIDIFSRENNLTLAKAIAYLYKLNKYDIFNNNDLVSLYSSAGSINSNIKDLESDAKKSKKLNIERIKIRIDSQKPYLNKIKCMTSNINELAVDMIANSYPKNTNIKKIEKFLEDTHEYDFLWIEEPLIVEKLHYFKKLKKQFNKIKFSYGENFNSSYDFINLIESFRFNYINPDISHITIQDFLNIVNLLKNKNSKSKKIILHCWGGVINLNMSLVLASLLKDYIKYVEFPIADFSLNEKYISECNIKKSTLIINDQIIGNPDYFINSSKIKKIKKKSVFNFD
tara:strand:- start:766 stop:1947 length:1182 start_codon:yes stop_codon:yes gene_type:complete